jgi:hypothetical protein
MGGWLGGARMKTKGVVMREGGTGMSGEGEGSGGGIVCQRWML